MEQESLWKDTAEQLSGSNRRIFKARVANLLGRGGQRIAERVLGWNRGTIRKGQAELKTAPVSDKRKGNSGRKSVAHKSPELDNDIRAIIEPTGHIVKGFRNVQYGHKINLSSEKNGFITFLSIEKGNPSDTDLFIPALDFHQSKLGRLPDSVVADGGYASQENVTKGRDRGVKRVVFHKPVGISLKAMGVKSKTFDQLRHFRAGVEGNISELKRAFGATKTTWKGLDGF